MPLFTLKHNDSGAVIAGYERVEFAQQPADPAGKPWHWEPYEAPEEPEPEPQVPSKVTNSQMKVRLAILGHLDAIDAFIDGIADPLQRQIAQIGWGDGNEVFRVSTLVQAAQAHMGWNDAFVDQLFIDADQIQF